MLNRFGPFSDRNQPHNASPEEAARFMADEVMADLLGRITECPEEGQYPIQTVFYEKLLQCHLLLPVPPGTDLKHGMPILALENNQGEKGLPLFTSEQTLELWVETESEYVALPFTTLCGLAMEARMDYIVLNASGPYGCEISFHDYSYLAEGLLPPPREKGGEIIVEKNTPMRLGARPDGLSEGMLARLNHLFERHRPLISRVYLFDVGFNDGPLQPALGIRVPDGCEAAWEAEVWPTMQAILHEMIERREVVNVFLLNQAGSMESHVQKMVAPIYESPSASTPS